MQNELKEAWCELFPNYSKEKIHVLPSIEHAVQLVREEDEETRVLVTGSLHLVGGLIEAAGLSEVVFK